MSEETQEPAKALSAEEILGLYRPDPKPIEIHLPSGGTLTFRPVATSKARRDLQAQILDYMGKIPTVETTGHKTFPNIDVIPKDPEDVFTSLVIHFRSLQPPIPLRTAFEYHNAPELVAHIEKELGLADKSLFEIQRQKAIDAAKKKSLTPGSEEGSPSAFEPSQDETPTT